MRCVYDCLFFFQCFQVFEKFSESHFGWRIKLCIKEVSKKVFFKDIPAVGSSKMMIWGSESRTIAILSIIFWSVESSETKRDPEYSLRPDLFLIASRSWLAPLNWAKNLRFSSIVLSLKGTSLCEQYPIRELISTGLYSRSLSNGEIRGCIE